jgi:16S rRNA (guanine527-N7)-methyltransferase
VKSRTAGSSSYWTGEPARYRPGRIRPVTLEALPDAARAVFGARLPLAQRYADLLADAGVIRGLLGPREPARLWTRHLLNCAAVSELLPAGARVVDVGSGAGLPGVVLALCRPDLVVDLVEPLQRRVDFLLEVVSALTIGDRVRVHRGRAEEPAIRTAAGGAHWVTARAVAPLDRLARWCAPLLAVGGRLAALKGAAAEAEVAEHRAALNRLGMTDVRVVTCGAGLVQPPVSVVLATRSALRNVRSVRTRGSR